MNNSEKHCCCKKHKPKPQTCCCCESGDKQGMSQGKKILISFFALIGGFLFSKNLPVFLAPEWIAIFLCGLPICKAATIALFTKRKITSALLVTLAMIGAICLQFYNPHGEKHSVGGCELSYLFAAAEVAFLMALGEWLEMRTIKKSQDMMKTFSDLLPQKALVKKGDSTVEIASIEIKKGDVVCVKPHDIIVVDGIILSGTTNINEASITGESTPAEKSIGTKVFAGTENLEGYIEIQALGSSVESEMAKLERLVEEASGTKAPIVREADKWATYVIPCAIVAATLVCLIAKFTLDLTWLEAIIRGVTVLIVFCPCAFVLATPTAISAAIGNLMRKGVIVKSGEALESVAKTSLIFFDKTGTLTHGNISVERFEILSSEYDKSYLARLASTAEMHSEHPIAKAICAFAKQFGEPYQPHDLRVFAGIGVEALCDGKSVKIERVKETHSTIKSVQNLINDGLSVAVMSVNDTVVAVFGLSDTIRKNAKETIKELCNIGIESALLSGDNRTIALKTAQKIGIEKTLAPVLPSEKLDAIKLAQQNKSIVCMVGDGINDIPALTQANVSIAIASLRNSAATESAQICVSGDNLQAITQIIKVSRRTLNIAKANMIFSVALNTISVLLAFFGIITPVIGALIHNCSSVGVVLNSARILRFK